MNDYKKQLWKKYDQFDLAESDDEKRRLRDEIKSVVDEQADSDAQDWHMLGLTWYETAQDLVDINFAHLYFLEALERDDHYNIARLYSAHCYHDKKVYDAALEDYLKVDEDALRDEFALWRLVKMLEQIGFCCYQLGNKAEAGRYFKRVLAYYQKENYDDLVDAVEVYECLAATDPVYVNLKEIEKRYYDDI